MISKALPVCKELKVARAFSASLAFVIFNKNNCWSDSTIVLRVSLLSLVFANWFKEKSVASQKLFFLDYLRRVTLCNKDSV